MKAVQTKNTERTPWKHSTASDHKQEFGRSRGPRSADESTAPRGSGAAAPRADVMMTPPEPGEPRRVRSRSRIRQLRPTRTFRYAQNRAFQGERGDYRYGDPVSRCLQGLHRTKRKRFALKRALQKASNPSASTSSKLKVISSASGALP